MTIDKETIKNMLEDKEKQLQTKIDEYKKYLESQINWCRGSVDVYNVAVNSCNYAREIGKLEGEIQQLQNMMLFIN